MDSMQPVASGAFRARLDRAGYVLMFRATAWTECLVSRSDERWVGRGAGEEDALGDVLRQMFTSHLSRTLLAAELRAFEDGADRTPRGTADPSAPPLEMRASAATEDAPVWPPVMAAEALNADDAAVAPGPEASAPEVKVDTQPAMPTRGDGAAQSTAETTAIAPETPQVTTSAVLAALDAMLREIEDRLPDFSLLSAERQRLELVTWICQARGYGEALPDVREVDASVSRVARRLGEIARVYWPGFVAALQLNAEPDRVQELRVGGSSPSTWTAASQCARQILTAQQAQDRAAGLDEHGWADAASLVPRPADPDAMFEDVGQEVRLRLGGEPTDARVAALQDADVEALLVAARKLRWLRGATAAPISWGLALGMLRRAAHFLGPRAMALRAALDARVRPNAPWQQVVTPTYEPVDDRGAVMADLPASLDPPERLVAWVVRAFDVMATPDVAAALTERRANVVALDSAVETQQDRRLRRRLRELVRRLRAAEAGAATPSTAAEGDTATEAPSSMPSEARENDALAARVRARTKGQRALFVSNREDPELAERLTEALGVAITWCDGSQRKVQAQEARLAKGGFDLVLCASGFQSHAVDTALARAAQSAGVPYVRVNRGRTVACVQAIAREFGLLSAPANRHEAVARSNA